MQGVHNFVHPVCAIKFTSLLRVLFNLLMYNVGMFSLCLVLFVCLFSLQEVDNLLGLYVGGHGMW